MDVHLILFGNSGSPVFTASSNGTHSFSAAFLKLNKFNSILNFVNIVVDDWASSRMILRFQLDYAPNPTFQIVSLRQFSCN